MAAQPLVTIQPAPADIAATGVKLMPIDAPEHAAALSAILEDKANLIAPLLPNSVLVVNGSSKKLRGIGVFFKWSNPKSPRGTMVVMTSLDKGDDPRQTKPGEIELFTPVRVANIFFSRSAANRKASASAAVNTVASSATTDFNNLVQQGINELAGLSGVQATIESLSFEDYSYLGSDSTLRMLQRHYPEIHR